MANEKRVQGQPVCYITKAGLRNFLKGSDPEKHVLLRRDVGDGLRVALYTRPSQTEAPLSDRNKIERLAFGYELMFEAICHLAATSGAGGNWYRELASKTKDRVSPLWDIKADSNPGKPGDCKRQYLEFMASISKREAPQAQPVTLAASDVLAERQRQVETEGWTPEHDDEHDKGEMALAAASYAFEAAKEFRYLSRPVFLWPWSTKWWKPTTPRRDLVKAGALILAEIERRDRKNTASTRPIDSVGERSL